MQVIKFELGRSKEQFCIGRIGKQNDNILVDVISNLYIVASSVFYRLDGVVVFIISKYIKWVHKLEDWQIVLESKIEIHYRKSFISYVDYSPSTDVLR